MSYDNIYKKLMAGYNCDDRTMDNQDTISEVSLQTYQIGKESSSSYERLEETKYKPSSIDYSLEAVELMYPKWTIALEEDNPFDGFGEDSGGDDNSSDDSSDDSSGGDDWGDWGSDDSSGGDDNPFGGDDSGGDSGGNPFDDGGDDSGGDFFGSSDDSSDDFFGGGDDDNEKKQKKKVIKLNRKKTIEDEHDMNKQVRAVFPKRFLELQDIIKANISMCERVVIQDSEHIELFDQVIQEYNRLGDIVDAYLNVIIDKPHDDIFATYFSIYANLSKLKDIYNELVGNVEKSSK